MSAYSYREGTENPLKDACDHGPDALRYFVSARFVSEPQMETVDLR
jgi:hypothetical protein